MKHKNQGRDKGKGMAISGIPLAGGMSQVDNTSVETNRFEDRNAFHEGDDVADVRDFEHRDYIGDQKEADEDVDAMVIASKDNNEWSEGMEDEANPTEDYSEEALFPESQPLHIDLASTTGLGQDDLAFPLQPSTMDNQSDDFTDIEIEVLLTKNKTMKKKSA